MASDSDGRKAMGLNEITQGSSEQGKEKRKEGGSGLSLGISRG